MWGTTPTSTRASAAGAGPAAERPRRHRAGQRRLHLAPAPAGPAGASGCTGSARPTPRGRSPPSSRPWRRRPAPAGGRLVLGRRREGRSLHPGLPGQPGGPRSRAGHRLRADPLPGRRPPPRHRCREASVEGPGGHSSRVDQLGNPDRRAGAGRGGARRFGPRAPRQGAGGFRGAAPQRGRPRRGHRLQRHPHPSHAVDVAAARSGGEVDELLAEAERRVRAAAAPHAVTWTPVTVSPPFATRDLGSFEPLLGERTQSPSISASGPRRRALRAGRRRGGVRPRRHRAGPRRRRVRGDRRARDGARPVRAVLA